ncbi:arginase [Clostridium polyendosporum]|uniref:Arginase n=1 Tax=Clostridium polyendosporum TaxID=69208 RepID=A0A919S131_9CLOT|nr:arginase [Clostridium polyendosporum]GIM30305.1 arginase [Clostridium polyendosporum]
MNINLIGVPMFYGCDRPGVELGPFTLRNNGLLDILKHGDKHNVYDLGNLFVETVEEDRKYSNHCKLKYLSPIREVNTNLAHFVYNSLKSDCFPFVVGGDHSLGLGSISGASKFFGDDLGVIWIDAHGDINTHETSPTGNVHGMPLAASMGFGYEDLTNLYFSGKKVNPKKTFIFCARDLDEGEHKLISNLGLNVWTTSDIKKIGLQKVAEDFYSIIDREEINNIHLSFDIDCLDSELVPGTGTPVNQGMNLEEAQQLLRAVFESRKIKSMDFVEFNPVIDKNNQTLNNCIEILNTIAIYL